MTDSHEGYTPDREVVGRGDGSANGEIVLGKETDIVAVNGHGNSDEDKDAEEKKEQQDQEQEQKEEQEEEKSTDTAQARQGRRVIVLCGLVGSGKSSFARALQTHFPRYVRCNQDELGSRQKVQLAAEAALRSRVDSVRDGSEPGTSTQAAEPRAFADKVAVIDRTNIDEGHRKPWVDMADQFGVDAEAMMFDTPYEVSFLLSPAAAGQLTQVICRSHAQICRERLLLRKDHETLKDPQRALE
ncbi:hypothetical protein L7F22_025804 [Adiantum nelumboides]|nr:hypothetical protein [Adiantum nelumboides]